MSPKPSILCLTDEKLDGHVAGPAIRMIGLATALANDFAVTLAGRISSAADWENSEVRVLRNDSVTLQTLSSFDAILSSGTKYSALTAVRLQRAGVRQIFDLYDPILFEQICSRDAGPSRQHNRLVVARTRFLLRLSDLIVCATPRQVDLWLGGMYLVGGFVTWSPWENPEARIINVPFGIPQEPPTVGPANIKHLGLDPYRPLVLWNGGIWDWMDPIVLLRAFRLLKDRDSSLQLLFMASRSCDGSETDAAKRAKDYAVRHDLLGNNVFFGEEWLPYEERVQWLRAATACVVSAPDHLESRFSCRTRLFDAIWARTPIVCTTGGYLAEETVRYSLGRTTAADSPTELAEALEAVVQPEAQELYRRNLEDYASGASWHQRTEVLRSRLAELLAKPSQPRSATVLALEYLRYKIACRLG